MFLHSQTGRIDRNPNHALCLPLSSSLRYFVHSRLCFHEHLLTVVTHNRDAPVDLADLYDTGLRRVGQFHGHFVNDFFLGCQMNACRSQGKYGE